MTQTAITDRIHDCVIPDFFMPNVTAEVTIGYLLTPKLPEIINAQCGFDTKYVAKEMSLPYATPRKEIECGIFSKKKGHGIMGEVEKQSTQDEKPWPERSLSYHLKR